MISEQEDTLKTRKSMFWMKTKNFLRPFVFRCRQILLLKNLFRDHAVDAWRFFKWSHNGIYDAQKEQMESAIIKSYHGFEKGLSLQHPKPGFGQEKAKALIKKLSEWNSKYEPSDMTQAAEDSLLSYHAFNRNIGVSIDFLNEWKCLSRQANNSQGGTKKLEREEVIKAVHGVSDNFFMTRHSIRNFSPEEVPLDAIKKAVTIAQKSPSVCNRQGVKVYCAQHAEDALKWQPGNKGFGDLASRGLVVTADLQAFCSTGERNQAFVDGGLFAMSLVYALHSMGYGSCMLAWSKSPKEESEVRKALNIKDNEVIIMMIAVGCLPEKLDVACSQRRPMSDILTLC